MWILAGRATVRTSLSSRGLFLLGPGRGQPLAGATKGAIIIFNGFFKLWSSLEALLGPGKWGKTLVYKAF